ncbi:MAG TPA: YbaB/EbfC family nucleoid-associated protein [Mariprofundaceae bacterium]|nr:YbaB/EbfC family nucleoid-associated protein [Mariprofundaceae bacterium]
MNIGKMMQQARQMQEKMQKMQEEMASVEVEGEAGGGMVKVTLSGDRVVRRVTIDPSLWEEQDKALLEDLVAAATNSALQAIESQLQEKQKEMMGGLPLPPGLSF